MAKRKSKKRYVPLNVFEKFLRKSGIENERQYAEAYRRKLIPTKLLPRVPSEYYHKPSDRVKYLPFNKARKYVRKLELQGREKVSHDSKRYNSKYKKLSSNTRSNTFFNRKTKLPRNIPRVPQQVYKKYWKGWNDFIGVKRADYTEAKRLVKKLKLTSIQLWKLYAKKQKHLGRCGFMINKKNDMRIGVPYEPSKAYEKYWKSWGDFLGNGNVQAQKRKFRQFKEARKYAQSLNLKNGQEWKMFSKKGRLPFDLPADPRNVYGKDYPSRKRTTTKGIDLLNNWKGWADWLGVKPGVSNRRKISHKESVARAKKGWANRKKKGNTGWSKDDSRRKVNKVKRKRRKKHDVK